nr:hypothetical protein pmam_416 [Pithovirus mammoth]
MEFLPDELLIEVASSLDLPSTISACSTPEFSTICDFTFWAEKSFRELNVPKEYFRLAHERGTLVERKVSLEKNGFYRTELISLPPRPISGLRRYLELSSRTFLLEETVVGLGQPETILYDPRLAFEIAISQNNLELVRKLTKSYPNLARSFLLVLASDFNRSSNLSHGVITEELKIPLSKRDAILLEASKGNISQIEKMFIIGQLGSFSEILQIAVQLLYSGDPYSSNLAFRLFRSKMNVDFRPETATLIFHPNSSHLFASLIKSIFKGGNSRLIERILIASEDYVSPTANFPIEKKIEISEAILYGAYFICSPELIDQAKHNLRLLTDFQPKDLTYWASVVTEGYLKHRNFLAVYQTVRFSLVPYAVAGGKQLAPLLTTFDFDIFQLIISSRSFWIYDEEVIRASKGNLSQIRYLLTSLPFIFSDELTGEATEVIKLLLAENNKETCPVSHKLISQFSEEWMSK